MIFSTIPCHFAPAFVPILYEIEANEGEDIIDVEVSDASTGALLGVKRFKGTGKASANVAGYVRRMLGPEPAVAGGFRFSRDAGRQAAITVRAGGAVAPERIFTCSLVPAEEFGILSKMPCERALADGEWDELSIAVPDTVLSAEMRVTGDGADFTLRTGEFAARRGIATLTVDSRAVAEAAVRAGCRFADCRRAEVKIYSHGELIGAVAYGLYRRGSGQRRLCWLNSMGGIDCHTFNSAVQESLTVAKQRIFSGGRYRTVTSAAEKTMDIVSGYCAPPLADALAEIVGSPRVWLAVERTATPLDVVTDKVVVRDGSLFCLKLSVREQSGNSYEL